jgi:nucleotide-binding universal stress UspA family protein
VTQPDDTMAPARASQAASAIRSILLHVEPDPQAEPRVHAAADLARRLDAVLIGVGAEMIQSLGVTDPFGVLGAEWVVELQRLVVDNLKRAEASFRAGAAGLTTQWLALEAVPAPAIAALSRGADLIIAGGAPLRFTDDYRVAQTAELVLLSGCPVLVVPPEGGRLRGEAVVVAWKDTRESRRAVADSMPFLQMAEEVVVQEVCHKDAFGDAEGRTFSVVENLKRHGVPARAKVTIANPDHAAGELKRTARQLDADLIVAGGYGHSRLGEWVFGGVTRSLLQEPQGYLLLSH